MEKNKNNALEKAENIANKGTGNAKSGEEIRADKRVKMAEIKLKRKEKKEELKVKALQEKERAKAEEKERKQRIKAERKAEKEREKRENRKDKKGYAGWLTAVITLGIATLVLSSVLTFTFLMPSESDTALETVYRRSFYDTVDQVNNIDLNLSKILSTKDSGAMQTYLLDLSVNSELCENDLHELPLEDESKYYTTKLVNQIGDFAKYLNKKIANGENPSVDDKEILTNLYKANLNLLDSLNNTVENMGNDFSFSKIGQGDTGNLLVSNFSELQNLSVEYPELIYDGPFSDGITEREIKGLSGDKIDENGAISIFTEIFGGYGLNDIKCEGVSDGEIKCFNVTATVKDDILYAQISETGGKLIMFSYAGDCNEVAVQSVDAEATALNFVGSLGIPDMTPVWINLSNNLYTVNLASTVDGVIVYSDLIKVRVCAETNTVIGLEASAYYTNHTKRELASPELSLSTAYLKVSDDIEVDTGRLVIIPVGETSEKLCYEFLGTRDGSTYYIYIDAISGRQVNMFKVIESTEGTLLM